VKDEFRKERSLSILYDPAFSRSLPPHPGPLPQGEGESYRVGSRIAALGSAIAWRTGVVLALALMAICSGLAAERSGKVENFSLPDQQGAVHELHGEGRANAVVLVFTSTGCPIVQKSIPKIKALRDEFGGKGIMFWLMDSNAQDDKESIAEEARDFKIDLPILIDHSQVVARSMGVKRTAEAICIETKSWTVFYRGAIDDQLEYGTERKQAGHNYLESALKNFLAGKKIGPARTEVKGCLFHFEHGEAVEKTENK